MLRFALKKIKRKLSEQFKHSQSDRSNQTFLSDPRALEILQLCFYVLAYRAAKNSSSPSLENAP